MTTNKLSEMLERWGKYIGFLAAIAGLASYFAGGLVVAFILVLVSVVIILFWLWGISHQSSQIRQGLLSNTGLEPGTRIYTEQQRKWAERALGGVPVVAILFLGVLGWLIVKTFQPVSSSPNSIATSQPVVEKILWNFQSGTAGWQAEAQKSEKPEYAVANVSWDAPALRANFDFRQIDPKLLPAGIEPRATFFVKDFHENWAPYQTLKIDAVNLSPFAMKLTFTVFAGDNLWHEFGDYQNLPPGQSTELSFDLNAHKYKTFYAPNSYDNSHVIFDDVYRFDLIVGTSEASWNQVQGAIHIDKIWLTGSSLP